MKYKELTEKIIGCAYRVYNLFNFGKWKVEIKRKLRDFDKDLQDEFWFFNPEYPVNPVKKVSMKDLVAMNLISLIETIKRHPHYNRAGMILCHNGVVRGTSRDGRRVSGLNITVDYEQLHKVIEKHKKRPGIIEIVVKIAEDKELSVGDDVMFLVVAGDIRENVIKVLSEAIDDIKSTVVKKTEYFL